MDGASKFVRGDAVAGLIITAINIIGGLAAGLLRDKMSLAQAAETYFILTIGDGLVSQMPALLVSTAAGIIVTRAGAGTELGPQVGEQFFGQPEPLMHAAGGAGRAGAGAGHAAAVLRPAGRGGLHGRAPPGPQARRRGRPAAAAAEAAKAAAPERLTDLIALDALELEVGHGLLPLIDIDRGGELPGRVASLRRQLATDLGIVLPPVHLRDNLRLEAAEYRIRLRGMEIGTGVAHADRLMLLEPSGGSPELPGVHGLPAKEPAFGLPALWILPGDRGRAEAARPDRGGPGLGADHPPVSELLRRNAHELVGRQEVQELLAAAGKEAPKLVEDVIPGTITLGDLVRVVRGLLREGLSIRDLRTHPGGGRRRRPPQQGHRLPGRAGAPAAVPPDHRQGRRHQGRGARPDPGPHPGRGPAQEPGRRATARPTLAPDVNIARRFISGLESRAANLVASGRPAVIIAPSRPAPSAVRLRLALRVRPVGHHRARAGARHRRSSPPAPSTFRPTPGAKPHE